MAKKNFYAVKVGKTPGIYRSWEECKSQTEGVSGAVFKGFATEEEAKLFMGMETTENKGTTDVDNEPGRTLEEGEALAYVDGSYNVDTGEYSCGVVFFYEGTQKNFCKKGEVLLVSGENNFSGTVQLKEQNADGYMALDIIGVDSMVSGRAYNVAIKLSLNSNTSLKEFEMTKTPAIDPTPSS